MQSDTIFVGVQSSEVILEKVSNKQQKLSFFFFSFTNI